MIRRVIASALSLILILTTLTSITISASAKGEKQPFFYIYTNYNGMEKETRIMDAFLRGIDVNDDGKKDIKITPLIYPKLILDPKPSLALVFKLSIRRISEDIRYGDLTIEGRLRIPILMKGYSVGFGMRSPSSEKVPKICSLSYIIVPHLLSLKKKPSHMLEFRPVTGFDKDTRIIIFASVRNESGGQTTFGIHLDPAVSSRLEWKRSRIRCGWDFEISKTISDFRETDATFFLNINDIYANLTIKRLSSSSFNLLLRPFSRYGGKLHYERESLDAAGIGLSIKTRRGMGSISVENLPKKIDISWLLRREGYIQINSFGGATGRIEAEVSNILSMSFLPKTYLNAKIEWRNVTAKGLTLLVDSSLSLHNFLLKLGENFSWFSKDIDLGLSTDLELGGVRFELPYLKKLMIEVKNLYLSIDNSSLEVKGRIFRRNKPPTVSIDYPANGTELKGIVEVVGRAYDEDGRVEKVEIAIDGKEWKEAKMGKNNTWTYVIDTTDYLNGVYTISARSFDGLSYSDIVEVEVTINNTGVNWRPSVIIDRPAEGEIVEGKVRIEGRAMDPDGTVRKVQVKIDDGEWSDAIGTDNWYYEWNCSKEFGKHKIYVRCIDDEEGISREETRSVWVRYRLEEKVSVEFILENASLNIRGLSLRILNFSSVIRDLHLEGNVGISLDIGPDSFDLEACADTNFFLRLVNPFSLRVALEGSVPYFNLFLKNSSLMIKGKARAGASASVDLSDLSISMKNATLSFDGIIDFNFASSGEIYFLMEWEDKRIKKIDIDIDGGAGTNVTVDDLVMRYDGRSIFSLNHAVFNGSITVKSFENGIKVESGIDNLSIDNLQIGDLLSISLSGKGSLSISSCADDKEINITSSGSADIFNLRISGAFGNKTFGFYAEEIGFDQDSYLKIAFCEGANVGCRLDVNGVYARDVYLSFDNYTKYCPIINLSGYIDLNLSANLSVEKLEDGFIVVVTGGEGYLEIHSTFRYNDTFGGVDGRILVESGKRFVVIIQNISGKIKIDIDGGAVISIDHFRIWYGEKIDVSIQDLNLSFNLSTTKGEGCLTLIGEGKARINTTFDINGKYLTIMGSFNFGGDGKANLTISWNESSIGLGGSIEISTDCNISMENIRIRYGEMGINVTELVLEGRIFFLFESDENTTRCVVNISATGKIYQLSVNLADLKGRWYLSFLARLDLEADLVVIILLYA